MTFEELLDFLDAWTLRGWIRSLDRVFVLFLKREVPEAKGLVLLAAALTSHQLGRGHICLDLEATLADPDGALSLPPEGESGEAMPSRPSEILVGLARDAWEEALKASPLVTGGERVTPLVLDTGRLYLRRFWGHTRDVADSIIRRLDHTLPLPDNLALRLDNLFSFLDPPEERSEISWQKVAAAVSARRALSIISGGPGTGKTTTVIQLLGLLQGSALEKGEKLRIRLAAPTGKAAARLTESLGNAVEKLPLEVREHIPDQVTTLHRLLGSRPNTRHFVHNRKNLLHVDLLVVDEASMIDLEMMAAMLAALPDSARLILLGDKDQLASVEAGSVLGDLCRRGGAGGYNQETLDWLKETLGCDLSEFSGSGTLLDQQIVVLRKSHRFGDGSGIGCLARAVNQGDIHEVEAVWRRGFSDISQLSLDSCGDERFTRLVLDGGGRGAPGYRAYLERFQRGPEKGESQDEWLGGVLEAFNRFQILSALRKDKWGVEGLNETAAAILLREGLIPRTQGWYPGRPVLVTRNDYALGLMNGDVGILLPVTDHRDSGAKILKVVFPMFDGTLKKVLPSRLNHVETVYAMTVHKSQGSEFEHTALVLPDRMGPVLTRELVYTGITRAKCAFTLVTPRPELLGASVLRPTFRASGLGDLLDRKLSSCLPPGDDRERDLG